MTVPYTLLPATRDALKSSDPDRCRAALLADADVREKLMLLYAFHYELSKVPNVTSEPMLGAIRYQWWREAVGEWYGDASVRRHEITTPMAALVAETGLRRFWFDQLIDGRERDLDPRPFADMAEAELYAAQTSGQLAQIAARLCGSQDTDLAKQLGKIWGMCGLVRAYRFYADKALADLKFEDLRDRTAALYEATKTKMSPDMTPAVAYVALVPEYLKRADPVQPRDYSPLRKQMRIMRVGLTGQL